MLKLALRSIQGRWARFVLTLLAVLASVSFVSGTFVFTDSINAEFEQLFEETSAGVDVVVRSDAAAESAGQLNTGDPFAVFEDVNAARIPESVADDVADVRGVAKATPSIAGLAAVLDADGEVVGINGPPKLLFSWSELPEESPLELVEGRGVQADDEVIIDIDTAEGAGAEVGDQVRLAFAGGTEIAGYELVGILELPRGNATQGATFSALSLAEAQRRLGATGLVDFVDVQAEEGVGSEQLQRRIEAALPEEYDAITREESTREQVDAIASTVGFLTIGLLAFAGIATFVSIFTIFNTFSIVLAQRLRELGLQRAVGASRAQVFWQVVLEALLIGLVAAALGIPGGVALATFLRWVLEAVGITLPGGSFALEPRTVLVALAVGILVTVVAAVVPAWRAGRTSPMEALREAGGARPAPSRAWVVIRTILLALLLAAGVALTAIGLVADLEATGALWLVAAGFVFTSVALALLGSAIVRPVAFLLGPVFRLMGVSGDVARRTVANDPRRTAITAAALMVGLGIACIALVFTASLRLTIDDNIERSFGADLIVSAQGGGGGLYFIPDGTAGVVRDVEGVERAAGLRSAPGRIDTDLDDERTGDELPQLFLTSVEDDDVTGVLRADAVDGDAVPGGDELVVTEGVADREGLALGDEVGISVVDDDSTRLELVGILADTQLYDAIIPRSSYSELVPAAADQDDQLWVDVEEGADVPEVADAIEGALEDDAPFVVAQDVDDLKEQVSEAFDQILGLFFGLLGLSVLIALFGIINTLALGVIERTRELGLLRAVGMTRRQLFGELLAEGVVVALIGALLGLVLGIGFGIALVLRLADEGLQLAIPVGGIAVLVLGAVVAGAVAAILPGWRASRLDVLRAVQHD